VKESQRLLELFSRKLGDYTPEERQEIMRAARTAAELHMDQRRESGERYLVHPIGVAEILVRMRMDAPTIAAALLHDVLEDTPVGRKELRAEFGKEVESLVQGVSKISQLRGKSRRVQQAEVMRKMLVAMVRDIRVILIKLADKLHNMRTLEFLDAESRKRTAEECLDTYAPLADRLGIYAVMVELQNLALKNLQPEVYAQIVEHVSGLHLEREAYLTEVREALTEEATEAGIAVEMDVRIKHIYSIYRKMKTRGKTLPEIYDLLGVRLLCATPTECYGLLGLVHKLWKPIEGRFKDYIAMPKSNRYQSLHTTVMGPAGKMIEFQIRTQEMHATAEAGVAAHWVYKQGGRGLPAPSVDVPFISKIRSWEAVKTDSEGLLEQIRRELLRDSIYVFTPKGDVIELPKGSTAIDFAYHIHTEVGDHTLAAKADGAIVPLNRELKNTQAIEIVTSASARPHLNWLRYAKTSSTRYKIRHWLKEHDESLVLDHNIVARPRPAAPAGVGAGGKRSPERVKRPEGAKVGIRLGTERNYLIRIAECCTPTVGDDIVGYVSRGRGIIVHKASCPNLASIKEMEERMVPVEWETVAPRVTHHFQVVAHLTTNLFSEIEGAIRKHNGHLVEGKLEEEGPDTLRGVFSVELDSRADFARIRKSISSIPSIINAQVLHIPQAGDAM
jgi:GTP diphosphokinase / guanosine-3',5'-bis(diphosphate) 3'-diphosphatase